MLGKEPHRRANGDELSCYGAKAGALGDMQWGRNRRRPLDTANYLTQAPRCRSPRAVARNHNSRKTVGCANRNLEPSVYDDYPKPNRRKPLPIALTSYDGLWSQVRSGITNRICQHLTEFSLRRRVVDFCQFVIHFI